MDEKKQGRGRPAKGNRRCFRCSDAEWALVQLAAKLNGQTASDLIRDTILPKAEKLMASKAEFLKTITLKKPELQQAAAEYLRAHRGTPE